MNLATLEGRTGVAPLNDPACLRKLFHSFVGNVRDELTTKTAFGLCDWMGDEVLGQWRLVPEAIKLGLPELDAQAALRRGALEAPEDARGLPCVDPPRWRGAPLADALTAF